MVKAGVAHQDSKSYFYTGILAELAYASLKQNHPNLVLYKDSAFSNGGVMLGVLLGRQWMEYVATELTFEWLLSYAGTKTSWFSSELIETDLSFYTLGVGLDCMPMLPILDSISLLGVLGIGYKKANIKVKEKKYLIRLDGKSFQELG